MSINDKLRRQLYIIIFHADTPAGKAFDIALIGGILISVLTVMLDSVSELRMKYGDWFVAVEWLFTILFTAEYLLRIYCVDKPIRYIFSFYGIVDLLSILPTYLSLFVGGAHYLLVIRVLRVLRVFRILRLAKYVSQANLLLHAIRQSRQKVTVFLFSILVLVTLFGCMMYLIEGPANGYTSIPRSIYWAIVTLTTVGYGDIAPRTDLGQGMAAMVMVMGYAIIAVPTGIFTAELSNVLRNNYLSLACRSCEKDLHEAEARFCSHCGARLPLGTVVKPVKAQS
ncbi:MULTISPECIES: ion transporter [unclassified Hahella]|uniref:ion transporter n=1 Tax=unclassified Hahella TaxID=2624107 RepID=UPI001C1F0D45|nr:MULTISPECIES: ion transporter [unclassified Hahella]MBU6949907.1 ion transporter [Hahella sp. HN01]MDG9668299.1 ion transporter [Hahella sp. CR1]